MISSKLLPNILIQIRDELFVYVLYRDHAVVTIVPSKLVSLNVGITTGAEQKVSVMENLPSVPCPS